LSSPTVRQVANAFAGLATTARLSNPNGSSISSTPADPHCAISAALIGRDAPAMSISRHRTSASRHRFPTRER
jgi:hypothetical protein